MTTRAKAKAVHRDQRERKRKRRNIEGLGGQRPMTSSYNANVGLDMNSMMAMLMGGKLGHLLKGLKR